MKKDKIIKDIIFTENNIQVFYSNGRVYEYFKDEINEYIYSNAKKEVEELKKDERNSFTHFNMSAMALLLTGIPFMTFNAPIGGTTYSKAMTEFLFFLSSTYIGVVAFDYFNIKEKERNIIKSIETIRKAMNEIGKDSFTPTFLNEMKLSDSITPTTKNELKIHMLNDVIATDIEAIKRRADKIKIHNNVVVLEDNNEKDFEEENLSIEKPKTLGKTFYI